MLKVKTFIILIIIYLISFFAIKTNKNLFYPYYLLKDLIYFPVQAVSGEVEINEEVEAGLIAELQREIQELKEINGLSSTLTEFDSVTALVLNRNRMYWFNTITINSGSDAGLEEDMAVISGEGLIGRVQKVSKTTSEIKLITTNDINSKISVTIQSADDTIYGIMSGYDSQENLLEISSTNKDIENLEGSKVYTSGMGGIFPSGILIGEVFKIEEDKYDVSKTIKVTPASDFSNFRFVKVLIRKEYAS